MKLLKKINTKRIIAIVCCMALLGTMIHTFRKENASVYGAEPIKSTVKVGDKSFTADKKLRILEIVPDKALAELGYMIGGENCPITWEQVMSSIKDDIARVDIAKQWLQLMTDTVLSDNQIRLGVKDSTRPDGYRWYRYEGSNLKYYEQVDDRWESALYMNSSDTTEKMKVASILNSDTIISIMDGEGKTYQYQDNSGKTVYTNNLFAYYVFSGYDMCNKMKLTTKRASDVKIEDIQNSDLVYVNSGCHNSEYMTFYQDAMKALEKEAELHDVSAAAQSKNNFEKLSQDLKASVMWYLYMAVANEDTALIFDHNTAWTDGASQVSNIQKLYYLVFGADRDAFREHFWGNEDSELSYHGTLGKLSIEDKGTEQERLEITINGYGKITWEKSFGDLMTKFADKYYNPNYSDMVNKNVYCFNGHKAMDQDFLNGYMYIQNLDQLGTTMKHAYEMLGEVVDGKKVISHPNTILYILGLYRGKDVVDTFDGVLKVLEIEPANTYKYSKAQNTLAKTRELFLYFGYAIKDMNESNYKNYIDVKSVPVNTFIGMTEDIINHYDLIVMSDYNVDQSGGTNVPYIDTGITKVYTAQGPNVILTDEHSTEKTQYTAALSGNDLTDKAFRKLLDYVKAGKPLVLADSIYEGNKDIVDENTNVYRLNKENLLKELQNDAETCEKLKNLFDGDALGNVTNESNIDNKVLHYSSRPVFSVNERLRYQVSTETGIAVPNIEKSELAALNFSGMVAQPNKSYSLEVYVDKDANGFYTETDDDRNELLYQTNSLVVNADGSFSVVLQKMDEKLRGYLQWKAVLTDNDSHMSSDQEGAIIVGYEDEEKQTVKVLQIVPKPVEDTSGKPVTLSLASESFTRLMEAAEVVTGIKMDLTIVTAADFAAWYEGDGKKFEFLTDDYGIRFAQNDLLTKRKDSGYDMIVLGFADVYSYQDISNEHGALDNIKYYIEMGNSVLMAHDVLSASAYSDTVKQNEHVNLFSENASIYRWSYNITSVLRDIIGMDRYGASVGKTSPVSYNQGYSNIFLQQYGCNEAGEPIKLYSNMSVVSGNQYSWQAQKLNTGQITQYPYLIGETLSIAQTHNQYFQLNLESQGKTEENDVMVWYTLGSNKADSYYSMAGQDALNNYYIYSKGNITYSGAGHFDMKQEGELKLFVNTIIRAIGAGNNVPGIRFDEPAVEISKGEYEQTVRGTKIDSIHFTPFDEDMSSNGVFENGYLFWDKNGSGIYDLGDVLLKKYERGTEDYLENGKQYEVDLMKDYLGETGTLSDDLKQQILESIKNNEFELVIQVTDSNKGIGVSTLHLVNKQLFQLN